MGNTYVVINTKGGTGKTNTATNILTTFLNTKKVVIHELDNNNTSKLLKSKLKYKSIKIIDAENVLDQVQFEFETGKDITNVLDLGGGDDSLKVLQHFQKSGIVGLTYFIPCNDDMEQFDNVLQTIRSIKVADIDPIIYLIFNRVNDMQQSSVKEQFIGFFGSELYGIPPKIQQIQKDVNEIFFVPNSRIFSILKNFYQISLSECYHSALDMTNNIQNYKQAWQKLGEEEYKKNLKVLRFSKDVLELVEQLKPFQKVLKNEK